MSKRVKFQQYISGINFFETYTSSVDTLRHERLSTRLYVVVLIICITILVFYTGLVERSETRTIFKPSQSVYDRLKAHYSDSLQCPCAKIAITRSEFIPYIDQVLHPVCSSDLVSTEWLTYIKGRPSANQPTLWKTDFRRWSVLFFNTLASFCSVANSTVTKAIEEFQSRTFVSAQVISSQAFEIQMKNEIDRFQNSTTNAFSNLLGPVRLVSQSSALMSALGTNWVPKFESNSSNVSVALLPVTYNDGNCSCATSSACMQPASLFWLNGTQFYTVEDIFHGCTPFDSILLSSLRCFFSNSCISDFLHAFPRGTRIMFWGSEIFSMSPLKFSSNNASFRENDTVQTIIDRSLIDSWASEISYERYYNACAPLECTYLYGRRLDIGYVFITFLSVYSGLSTVLRFVVPRLITFLDKVKILNVRNRIEPT